MTLACVIPDITNPFYPGFVRGVQQVAGPAGYDVMITDTDGTEAGERKALAWLRQGRADGVVGTFFHLSATDLAALSRLGIAVVRLENRAKPGGALPIDSVCIDNGAAAAALTGLLLARGHRRIALIAGALGPGDQRVAGYTAAMRAAGLRPDVLRDPDFSAAAGQRCTARLLRRRLRPTAVFGANDLLAIGAMTELRNVGLAIPTDVAVAGFDDIAAAALVMPGLTTVRQHEQALGAAGAEMLVARLAPGGMTGPGQVRCLAYEIIERGSV
jgi:LacI family transcriptional regulator